MNAPLHHPSEDRLLAYVTGQVDAGLRLLLEAHLGACDACAAKTAAYSEPGGSALSAMAPQPSSGKDSEFFDSIMARVDELEEGFPFLVGGEAVPVPERLAAILPKPSALRWQGLLRKGVRYAALLEDQVRQAGLYLVHIKAGCSFPAHAHVGLEQAVILAGGTRDAQVQMEAWDYQEHEPGSAHEPTALPDEDCWILTRLEGGTLRFEGWRGLVQRL